MIEHENGRDFVEVSLPVDVIEKLEAIATLRGLSSWREDRVIEWLINRFIGDE